MRLLKIESNQGWFFHADGDYRSIDSITKEDLLHLVDTTLDATLLEEVTFDGYDESQVKNQAHQIIYKNIYEKLLKLQERKREFIDESQRSYLTEYEKYKEPASPELT